MIGLGILCPNTAWKVTESAVTYIALGVILSRSGSDGLITVAESMDHGHLNGQYGVVQDCQITPGV